MNESARARAGGRPAVVSVDDIVRAGRELGMARLSVNAVAFRLGVSSAALYRHIEGRWELERLVGESLLAELELRDDPDEDLERHLVSFARQLRAFVLRHEGLATYLQVLLTRGEAGMRLVTDEVTALERRGYTRDAGMVVAGAVATLAIGLAAADDRRAAADPDGHAHQALSRMPAGPADLPSITPDAYAQLLLAAAVRGVVAVAPPGRPVAEFLAELSERIGPQRAEA